MTTEEKKVGALLERSGSLTGIVRTGWITVLVGCLYAWLTLAALHDTDLFLPERSLTLPIIGTEISPDGFFLFAPALLFALFFYFQLMLVRLWECYGQLEAHVKNQGDRIDGLTVDERVEPWFMTILIPHESRDFDFAARLIGHFLCWLFVPLTILALGYRYLRAHELPVTLYHCALIALAFLTALLFFRRRTRIFSNTDFRSASHSLLILVAYLALSSFLAFGSYGLMSISWTSSSWLSFMSPHAQLFRAQLSRRPPDWDHSGWRELESQIAKLEPCWPIWTRADCPPQEDLIYDQSLSKLRGERKLRLSTIFGAQLGHVPAPSRLSLTNGFPDLNQVPIDARLEEGDPCKNWPVDLVDAARNMKFADLREAYLARAELRCANLQGADLRGSDLMMATLEYAKLQDADLSRSKLQAADFRRANLENAVLAGSKIDRETILFTATMAGADFSGADMTGAQLPGAQMEGVNLTHAQVIGATLQEADLRGANLSGTDLSKTDLKEVKMQGAYLFGTILAGTDLYRADLTAAALRNMHITTEQLSDIGIARVFADKSVSVRLPEGMERPDHWPDETLDEAKFFGLWQGWRLACNLPAAASDRLQAWIKEKGYDPIEWNSKEPNCP